MSRRCCFLVGLVMLLAGCALAKDEVAVLYNGESELSRRIVLGDWGYVPRLTQVTTAVAGDTIQVESTNQFYPGMAIKVDGVTSCQVLQVTPPNTLRLNIAVRADAGSVISIDRPYQPVRLIQNQKIYGLNIATQGRYQGTFIDFVEPLDATTLFSDPNMYLELYLRAATDASGALITPQIDAGAKPPAPVEDEEDNGAPRPPAAITVPDLDGKPASVPLPVMTNLRFVLFTEKGQGLLVVTPKDFYPRDEVNKHWMHIAIPLNTIKKELPVGGKFTRMLITSDAPLQFQLGRLAFVRDADPLTVSMMVYPMFLEAKKRIFFSARVTTGLSRYLTTWDFNVQAGDSIDATGDRVTYTFDTEGVYTVTCTVRDLTGGKPPAKATLDVKVSRAME